MTIGADGVLLYFRQINLHIIHKSFIIIQINLYHFIPLFAYYLGKMNNKYHQHHALTKIQQCFLLNISIKINIMHNFAI